MCKLDPSTHNPNPEYIKNLVKSTGLTRAECAAAIGIPDNTLKNYMSSARTNSASYPVQFALEVLANENS